MCRAIQPPELNSHQVAQLSAGAVIGNLWQTRFYAHFDAFLSTARSVPEIIQCCFGVDQSRAMRGWLRGLDAAEISRREDFREQFALAYDSFRALPLSNTRHVIEHRSGIAPVEVTVSSLFGVTHVGGPARRIPDAETRSLPEEYQWMAKSLAVPMPMWQDFKVDTRPLFEAVQEYLNAASALVSGARSIANAVHAAAALTPPPS